MKVSLLTDFWEEGNVDKWKNRFINYVEWFTYATLIVGIFAMFTGWFVFVGGSVLLLLGVTIIKKSYEKYISEVKGNMGKKKILNKKKEKPTSDDIVDVDTEDYAEEMKTDEDKDDEVFWGDSDSDDTF